MTRKEAIKWVNKLYARADITDEYGDMEDMQPYEEAVKIAIKELERAEKLAELRKRVQEAMIKAGVFRIIDDNDKFFDMVESEGEE